MAISHSATMCRRLVTGILDVKWTLSQILPYHGANR
jgi:hypothetical protein